MKIFLLLIYFGFQLSLIQLSAQNLRVVKAFAGAGRNVNWPEIKKEENSQDGPPFFFNDCAQGVTPTQASSTLEAQGGKSYSISNLSDNDPMTAWVEGVAGYGIGEWFEVKAQGLNEIYNGYQATPISWNNNSRVERFKIYWNGVAHCFLDLKDEMGYQRFDLNIPQSPQDSLYTFRLEIVSVYKGAKWDDVAISHLEYALCCFSTTTQLASFGVTFVEASTVKSGSEILAYDLERDSVHSSIVESKASQQHVSLLRISAGGKMIEVTPEHPLYVKDRGFISMIRLREETPGKSYEELVGNFQVKLWDSQKNESYFATIDSIEKLEGDFQTITIRHLSEGSMYIANGFITKTY